MQSTSHQNRKFPKRRLPLALLLLGLSTTFMACGSGYTIIDRSHLKVSNNSHVSARNLVPRAAQYPTVVEQLALAQEVYQKQLFLLKERRNKLRSRKRYLHALSYGTLAATATGVGVAAIGSNDQDSSGLLKNAGYAALGGLAIGTVFQVAGYMQEDSSSVDAKVRQLELLYDTMIERLRQLTMVSAPQAPEGSTKVADMGAAIESFITQALSINVKG